MKISSSPVFPRIELLDAFLGPDLLGILLMHAIAHWDFMGYPASSPARLQSLDPWKRATT